MPPLMDERLTSQKLSQAVSLVAGSGVDAWVTFVRETSGGGDPALSLILDGALTWQSALIVTRAGEKIAVVGNYDADPLKESGDWTEIVPYVQGIKAPLLEVLERVVKNPAPKLAVNFSLNDDKADGLSHGMYLLLQDYLKGSRFENSLVSAEEIVVSLRSQKSSSEIERMLGAIEETYKLFDAIGSFARAGTTELEVFEFTHGLVEERGFGYAWESSVDPIVNSGPDSMIGHGIPSSKICIAPGHIFHVDLGIVKDDYSSDLQRCWYVPEGRGEGRGERREVSEAGASTPSLRVDKLKVEDGRRIPEDVAAGFAAVNVAISAGAAALKPGVQGWEVDAAARAELTSRGYEEYLHALGHQVGRVAHDGGALLGPKWERYGNSPFIPIQENQVFTLELGVVLPGRGYLGLEDMVRVTANGIEWLSEREEELWILD